MKQQRQSLLTQQTEQIIEQPLLATPAAPPAAPKSARFASLDVLRGLTIVGMLLVDDMYPQGPSWITHTPWNGLTVADLVFPSFLFIMGMAVPFALSPSKPFTYRNVIRIIGLFGIGVLLNLFEVKFNFGEFRVLGILQRLSVCYGALSIIHTITNYGDRSLRFIGGLITVAFIAIYLTFMLTFENVEAGCPKELNLSEECNFGAYWDRIMFGKNHMIYPNDPEGLFTNLSAFVNAYAGYLFTLVMFDNKNQIKKIVTLWSVGSVLSGLIALPLIWLMPLNKKIWSLSYAFLTVAISGATLAVITLLLDILGKHNPRYQKFITIISTPMQWLGRNPLAIFISRDVFDDICNSYIIVDGKQSWYYIQHYLFGTWVQDTETASFLFSVFLLLLFVVQAYVLYRNGLFLRL